MNRQRVATLTALTAACLIPACAPSPDGLPDSTDDDQVDLQGMLAAAPAPDITHGTEAYRAPAGAPLDERAERLFVAFLSGGQETPPVRTAAQGAMALILNQHHNRLRFVLQHDVADATVAHLHLGSAGESGPVAIELPKAGPFSTGTVSITEEQVSALLAGRLYVNVHSPSHPKGEIRGQVLRPGETVFVAALRGAEEVPAVASTASGLASLILSAARDEVHYRVTFNGIAPTLAHVHRGMAGTNGPVAHPLNATGAVLEGSFAVTSDDLQDLSLRRWYVNLHSAANPKGELRGQVVRPGEAVFAATMTGTQEVPPVTTDNAGNAMVVLGSAGAKFLYVIETSSPATLAHIHRSSGGSNGPVEVPLSPVGQSMSGVADLGPARQGDIERGLWYVNVHTAANPKGELRGQLLRPGESLFVAMLAGTNEVPPTTSTATGAVALILDAGRTEVRYDGTATGIAPTLAHVHGAPAGMNGPVVFPLMLSGAAVSGKQTVSVEQATALESGGLYVNLHSVTSPMGEIRGQLLRPDAGPAAPAAMPAPGPASGESHAH